MIRKKNPSFSGNILDSERELIQFFKNSEIEGGGFRRGGEWQCYPQMEVFSQKEYFERSHIIHLLE